MIAARTFIGAAGLCSVCVWCVCGVSASAQEPVPATDAGLTVDSGARSGSSADRSTTNVQPVIPISISEDWNLISRTIVPVIYQDGVTGRGQDQFGLGDVVQSAFFSPKEVGSSGIIWVLGPAFLLPAATDSALGSKKWGVGPTAVVLKQSGRVTYGMLVKHIWSVAGSDSRADMSQAFIKTFLSYTTPDAATFSTSAAEMVQRQPIATSRRPEEKGGFGVSFRAVECLLCRPLVTIVVARCNVRFHSLQPKSCQSANGQLLPLS